MAAPLLFHISSLLVKQAQRERDGALNANGERRFREMDKARSSLRKEYDALTSLAENGLTEQDRQTLREDYAVDKVSTA